MKGYTKINGSSAVTLVFHSLCIVKSLINLPLEYVPRYMDEIQNFKFLNFRYSNFKTTEMNNFRFKLSIVFRSPEN